MNLIKNFSTGLKNSCNLLTAGIPKGCDNNIGGIQKLYIIDHDSVLSKTEVSGEITAISLASGTQFYEFAFNKNTSNFTDNATISQENQSLFYAQTVTLKIPRREVSKRNTLALLMQKDLDVIVLDQNGLYWYLGSQNGLRVSELPSESGTAKGDFNGYTITMVGEEPVQAYEVDSAIVPALI